MRWLTNGAAPPRIDTLMKSRRTQRAEAALKIHEILHKAFLKEKDPVVMEVIEEVQIFLLKIGIE